MVVQKLKTFNTKRAVPYCTCLYYPSKYCRDITERELEKSREDCIIFKGTNCINEISDHVIEFTGEAKRVLY